MRDFEVLKRQGTAWKKISVYVGAYPGFAAGEREGLHYRKLGWGRSYAVSRLTFTLAANLRLLFDRADMIGNSISIYAPLLAGLLRPKRFFLVAHHFVGRRSLEKFGWPGLVPWFCEWMLFRFCRTLIVSNSNLAGRVRSLNPGINLLQSQNGYDNRLLEGAPEEASPPFILFLGRFDIFMKGLDVLVQAFAQVPPQLRFGVKLVLAGAASPKTLAAMGRLIPETEQGRVDLMPNVSEEKKRELLRTCLFFCSPSRFEGWGIAALEANAAGKPVLVTETDGFRDSIKSGFSGIMVPVGELPALVDGMRELLGNPSLRLQMGRNAREWAARFTWEGIASREREWLQSQFPPPHS